MALMGASMGITRADSGGGAKVSNSSCVTNGGSGKPSPASPPRERAGSTSQANPQGVKFNPLAQSQVETATGESFSRKESTSTSGDIWCYVLPNEGRQILTAGLRLVAFYAAAALSFWFLEDPGWEILDSIYYATVIMSTVGYGDIYPTNTVTRALTIFYILVGLIFVFAGATRSVDHLLKPPVSWMRHHLDVFFPPRIVSVTVPGGTTTDVVVPNHAAVYFLQGLSPLLLILVVLQFSFAGLLCSVQEIDFGTSFYQMMMTSTTVGLGEVKIKTPEAKIVMIVHILLTVGTLSSIVREVARIGEVRRKLINRLRLIMRKVDNNLLKELELSYYEYYVKRRQPMEQAAARPSRGRRLSLLSGVHRKSKRESTRQSERQSTRQSERTSERTSSRTSSRTTQRESSSKDGKDGEKKRRPSLQFEVPSDGKPQMGTPPRVESERELLAKARTYRRSHRNHPENAMQAADRSQEAALAFQIAHGHGKMTARKSGKGQHNSQAGLDKADFVVGMLVLLGVCEWEDAEPIMEHFDSLDTNGSGRLEKHEFQAAAAVARRSSSVSGLDELEKLMKAAGITDPHTEATLRSVRAARESETKGDFAKASKELENLEPFDEVRNCAQTRPCLVRAHASTSPDSPSCSPPGNNWRHGCGACESCIPDATR